jgi:hypothetical protein
MDIEQKAREIMVKFSPFMHGVRVCMLIDRGTQNSNKGSRRWVSKLISSNLVQLESNIKKLLEQQSCLGDPDIRLYMCVNARSMSKAIKHFQHAQIDVDPAYRDTFYSRINDSFCSSLMKPESRAENYFLIDYDSKDYSWRLESIGITEIFRYETPNGWHIITEPFYPKLLGVDSVMVKKDALLILNFLEQPNNESN